MKPEDAKPGTPIVYQMARIRRNQRVRVVDDAGNEVRVAKFKTTGASREPRR